MNKHIYILSGYHHKNSGESFILGIASAKNDRLLCKMNKPSYYKQRLYRIILDKKIMIFERLNQ